MTAETESCIIHSRTCVHILKNEIEYVKISLKRQSHLFLGLQNTFTLNIYSIWKDSPREAGKDH